MAAVRNTAAQFGFYRYLLRMRLELCRGTIVKCPKIVLVIVTIISIMLVWCIGEMEHRYLGVTWEVTTMPVIAIVNQKGGVGKTCLATNLASALADQEPTLLLDCDPQRSASGWAALNTQEHQHLAVHSVDEGGLVRQVRAAATEYPWVLIDCPPGITRVNVDAIRESDVVLIPCKPRVWDVWACVDIVEAVKLRQGGNRGRPKAAFVISMGRPRTRFSQQIGSALAELGLPILQSRTTEREAYAVAAGEGKSVLDGRDRVAMGEISSIRDEVQEMCDDIRAKTRIAR